MLYHDRVHQPSVSAERSPNSVSSESQKSVDLPISKEQTLFLAGKLSQEESPLGIGALCWQNTAGISQVVWTLSQIATQLLCANQSLCQATFTHITKHITIVQLAFEYFHKGKRSHIAKTERIRKTRPFWQSSEIYQSLKPPLQMSTALHISDLSPCCLSSLFLKQISVPEYLFRGAAFLDYLICLIYI